MSDVTDAGRGFGANAFETILFGVLTLAVALPTTIITSRYLRPAGRGAYVLGLVTVTLAFTLIGNVGIAVSRELKRAERRPREIVANALGISLVLGLVGAALLIPFTILWTPDYRAIALMPVALPAMLVTATLTATLLAVGRVRLRNQLQLAGPVTTLVAILVLVVVLGKGVAGAAIAWVIAQGVVAVFALVATARIWRPLELGALSTRFARDMTGLALRAGIVNVVSLLNYRIELFVLRGYHGVDAVGVYSVSFALAELLWIASAAFAAAVVAPALASSEQEAVAAIARAIRASLATTAILGVALAAVAPFMIPILFGDRFRGATVPLLILIPGVVAFAPGSVLGVYFSMRLGRMRIPLGISLLSVVLTGVLAFALIPPLGLDGAALASTIGYSVSMLGGMILFARRPGVELSSLVPRPSDLLAYRTFALGLLRR